MSSLSSKTTTAELGRRPTEQREINPLDFRSYQDYMDAYIDSSDVRYLQVC